MNLDYTKHQQKLESVHKKLVDEEEEYANAIKTHEKQTHVVLVCAIVVVILLVITAVLRWVDDSWQEVPTDKASGGVMEMAGVSYALTSLVKYLMYAGIIVLGVIIALNLQRRFYYTDPVSRDRQSYAQFVVIQEEVIRKLRAEEKSLEEVARQMEETAKQVALSEDRKTIGEHAEELIFSENGVMDGVRETDGELVLSLEDAWESIQEEAAYESDKE